MTVIKGVTDTRHIPLNQLANETGQNNNPDLDEVVPSKASDKRVVVAEFNASI